MLNWQFLFCTHRVGSGEVVASHHLHVGLFYQRDPELVPVAGVGAQHLSITINRQVVVYNHLEQDQSLFTLGTLYKKILSCLNISTHIKWQWQSFTFLGTPLM